MSTNHIYIELEEKVFARYIKTVPSILSGIRADPYDLKSRIPFILRTPESRVIWETETNEAEEHTANVVIKSLKPVIYEDEVLEVYSDVENRVFQQLNRKLLETGILIPYHETRTQLDTVNILSDQEILEIANSPSIPVFKKKLKAITSAWVLDRISSKLEELNRKPSFKLALAEYKDATVKSST